MRKLQQLYHNPHVHKLNAKAAWGKAKITRWFTGNCTEIYGSSRLGIYKVDSVLWNNGITPTISNKYTQKLGLKRYELSNHLGNVSTVISDRKLVESHANGQITAYKADIVSVTDYYAYGMKIAERSWGKDARYQYNGKEQDKGMGRYNFDGRMYDERSCRWMSLDPKAAKYAGISPYHFGFNNPVITIDPNGEENIVVVGNQGDDPKGDFHPDHPYGSVYRYKPNGRHFLEGGLNEALRLKQNTQNNEKTTMIIHRGNYKQVELDAIKKQGEAQGINVIIADDSRQIVEYINDKTGDRQNDLITDFSYVGHGGKDAMYTNYNADESEEPAEDIETPYSWVVDEIKPIQDLNRDAFHPKCNAHLASCGSGASEQSNGMFNYFRDVLTGGEVKGYRTTIEWGTTSMENPKEYKLGAWAPFNEPYAPPGQRENLPFLEKTKRTRIEQGKSGAGNSTGNSKVNGKDL